MKAYSVASSELSTLRSLYESSFYAFSQAEEVLRYKARRRHKTGLDPDLVLVNPILYKLKPSFRSTIRQQLRELIFTRLISVLETYLVDAVRDVFFVTKQPFMDQTVQVGFTQAEILAADSMSYVLSRIINKDCRRLTSGGFEELIKYYRSHFGIELTDIAPGKTPMREYHDRRHLLVHRLGKPDSQYRKKYTFAEAHLSVDDEYLTSKL